MAQTSISRTTGPLSVRTMSEHICVDWMSVRVPWPAEVHRGITYSLLLKGKY